MFHHYVLVNAINEEVDSSIYDNDVYLNIGLRSSAKANEITKMLVYSRREHLSLILFSPSDRNCVINTAVIFYIPKSSRFAAV